MTTLHKKIPKFTNEQNHSLTDHNVLWLRRSTTASFVDTYSYTTVRALVVDIFSKTDTAGKKAAKPVPGGGTYIIKCKFDYIPLTKFHLANHTD